ncbi:Acetyltransferase (GNAT) domain-containing protein [Gracilibacillus ureilyticus]|uniref:Acetyltransferase (GNAT) domain-containing protein n=1 Tax=Gracilibacillus ureilyticus TaxID=531814 RepID=A0A1H9V8M1_9BACI|nr:GNAT family N-acetyltransferase [Gracilibacillus ureilyticus]SES18042.1 Acetyltransferase (GNAT) domain-containing protein [Gracilibacillus ureilyticus]
MEYNEFKISDDPSLINLDTIYEFLQKSYWANKRPKEKIRKSIENSLCYGVYHGEKQVGFARVITDYATMYYLADVFIDEEYRGNGIGKKLIEAIINSEDLKDLFGHLCTKDAHTLYEQYHFNRETEKVMIRQPDFLRNR